jgi:threonine dehydrogenase-like Zn-dependent dehydrogenase
MKALVWSGRRKIELQQVPRPLLNDARDVILKVTSSSICGSDLHLFSGAMPRVERGDILGHEFMGIVEEVGQEVKTVKKGQRVVCSFDIACGACNFCKREEYTACNVTNPSEEMQSLYGDRTSGMFGYSHLTGGFPGGQAEFVRVPFADVNCLALPENVPDRKALYLSDIIPTSYHATVLAQVQEGSSVAIWGLGPVGLLAARWCQLKGAKVIIGIDHVPERLNVAKKLGIEVINFDEEDVYTRLRVIAPEGVDCGIEAAGFEYTTTLKHKMERILRMETDSADILSQMIKSVRKFGTIGVVGVYAGHCNHFPIGALMEKGLTIRGSQCPVQKYWKMGLEKIQSGEFDPSFVVSHEGRLEDGPELYERFWNKDQVIKVFLTP